jgi:hypothetical protein
VTILCPKAIRGRALRITRNDECGRPIASGTANSRHTTEAFTMFTFTPDVDSGTEIIRRNARGIICIRDVGTDQLKGMRVSAQFCGINTVALEMLTGLIPLTNSAGDTVGGVWPCDMDPKRNVSVELWSENDDDELCSGGFPYIQFAFPRIRNWQLSGAVAVQDDAVDVTLTGYLECNKNWLPSVAGEWEASHASILAEQGLWAFQGVDTLPTASECAYQAA